MEQAVTVVRSRFRLVLTTLTALGLLASLVALVVDRPGAEELVAAAPGDAPGFAQAATLDNNGSFGFGQDAYDSTLSGDGRWVAFSTQRSVTAQPWAVDPDRGSEADESDVYVRNIETGETTLISYGFVVEEPIITFAAAGSVVPVGRYGYAAPALPQQAPPPSESQCRSNDASDATIVLCESADDASFAPSISRDGRFVSFTSRAENLRDHDDDRIDETSDGNGFTEEEELTNWSGDVPVAVFVHDRDFDGNGVFDEPFPGASRTYLASLADEIDAPTAPAVELIAATFDSSISGDGQRVAFAVSGDCAPTCGANEIYVRDFATRRTHDLPQPPIEGEVPPLNLSRAAMSADGEHVAFIVDDTGEGETQVAVYDFARDASSFAGYAGFVGDYIYATERPSISGDGRLVAFQSAAPDLVPGLPTEPPRPYQVFVRERDPATGALGNVQLISADPVSGEPGNGHSFDPSISESGQYVAFSTGATNLHDDTSGTSVEPYEDPFCEMPDSDGVFSNDDTWCDVLVRDRLAPADVALEVASRADPFSLNPVGPNESAVNPAVSADGGVVSFETEANNLIPADPGDGTSIPPSAGDPNFNVVDVYAWTWTPSAIAGVLLNFGNVEIGQQSVAQTATFVHEGFGPLQGFEMQPPVPAGFGPLDALVPVISPGSSLPNEFEFVPGSNQCATLGLLHAGQTCGIGIVFRPQSTGSKSAAAVMFFQGPLEVASVSLLGGGRSQPPALATNPTQIDFGEHLIRSPSAPQVITIRNTATNPPPPPGPPGSVPEGPPSSEPPPTISISTVTIGGLNPDDFIITDNQCNARSLLPGQSCTVTVIFTAVDDGDRSAFVQINNDSPGSPHLVPLRGRTPTPMVQLNPALGPPGTVTLITGVNWPPNAPVTITSPGFVESGTATTDAQGKFQAELLIFPRSALGERSFDVTVSSVGLDPPATFLVVASTMQGGPDFVFRR